MADDSSTDLDSNLNLDMKTEELKEVDLSDDLRNFNFSFEENNTSTTKTSRSTGGLTLRKELTLFGTVTFVIGKIIGSGIFITPTRVLRYSGSFGLTLILWTLGGLFAIAGGLSYVELGNLIKNSGAEYAYLKEAYSFNKKGPWFLFSGNLLGFIFSWSYSLFIRPAGNAVITLTFGLYFSQAIAGGATPPDVSVKLFAIGAITFITTLNIYSLKGTSLLITITSVAKVLAIMFIVAIGLWQLIKGDHSHNLTDSFEDTSQCVGEIVLGLYSVLFSYEGWNAIGYTVEENKNVKRNLLFGMCIGVPCVMVCYICVNIAYFAGLSKSDVLSSQATALTLAQSTLGDAGLVIVPLMVAISTIGAATGGMFAGSRVHYTTARDGNFMEVFSLIQNKFQTPVISLLFQAFLTIIMIITGSIGHLINGLSTLMWVFYGLVFVGLLVMRITKRKEKRLFKVWFIFPSAMILVAIFIVTVPIILVPNERIYSIIALLLSLIGIPVYVFLVWDRLRPRFLTTISSKVTKIFMLLLDSSIPADYISSTDTVSYTVNPPS